MTSKSPGLNNVVVVVVICSFVCSFVRLFFLVCSFCSLARVFPCLFVYLLFRPFVRSHLAFVSLSFVYSSYTLSCIFNRV